MGLSKVLGPSMTLNKFEQAYQAAVEKHGVEHAKIIASAMKLTAEALGLNFKVLEQAKREQSKSLQKAGDLVSEARQHVEKAEERAKELELEAKMLREQAVSNQGNLHAAADDLTARAHAIDDILDLF